MKLSNVLLAVLSVALVNTASFALDSHVETVTRIVTGAKGKVEMTADGQGVRLLDLSVPGAGPHDHRKNDPYDAVFFEHVGHLATLESLNIISTKFDDTGMPHLAKLTALKSLRLFPTCAQPSPNAPRRHSTTPMDFLPDGGQRPESELHFRPDRVR